MANLREVRSRNKVSIFITEDTTDHCLFTSSLMQYNDRRRDKNKTEVVHFPRPQKKQMVMLLPKYDKPPGGELSLKQ